MSSSWHENEAFWHEMQSAMFTAERWQEAAMDVEQIIALLDPPPGAKVLDLACGPGRHALEFARCGYAVTGVDRTAAYLEEARRRAAEEVLDLELVEADMRDFARQDAFDLVVSLFTSFGYFDDPADDRRVAANFFASLKVGGRLVMDILGKEALAGKIQPCFVRELEDGSLMIDRPEICDSWRSVRSRWTLLRRGERIDHTITLRLYAASELIALLEGVGFAEVMAYGGYDGSAYDQDARRLVVVARKK